MTTLLLTALALVLAGPAPAVVARTSRLRTSPLAAMVLWQAMALAAVLAALGAGLSLATWTGGGPDSTWVQYLVAGLALGLTGTVVGRLLVSGHRVGTELRTMRHQHRELLDVLAEDRAGVHVVDHETPTAWCLPSLTSSRVVVSQGAFDVLDEHAMNAVLEHERAHLRSRHDLVIEAFTGLQRAFPAVVSSSRALAEVTLLAEVLADRAAVKRVGRRPLVEALSHLVGVASPHGALGLSSAGVLGRLEVLRDTRSHRVQSALLLVTAWALLVLPTLLVALPWLRSLPR